MESIARYDWCVESIRFLDTDVMYVADVWDVVDGRKVFCSEPKQLREMAEDLGRAMCLMANRTHLETLRDTYECEKIPQVSERPV